MASILAWGRPTIEVGTSTAGAVATTFKAIANPKKDSTKLETQDGEVTQALGEGDEVIDSRRTPNKYTLTFDLYQRKGETAAFSAVDGVVSGEYSIRITPEDPTNPGIQLDRCKVSEKTSFTSADGIVRTYTCEALTPATGAICKPYTKKNT